MTNTPEKRQSKMVQLPRCPLHVRVIHKVEDFVDDINWIHIAFKTCAFTYIAFMIWIAWQVLPIHGHWDASPQLGRPSETFQDVTNYFDAFRGAPECKINAADLYTNPPRDGQGNHAVDTFCPSRKTLLQAMSNGGRIGFDVPYESRGCHYSWFSTVEICMILERFDSLVFVGDDTLQSVYNGFNILLRQDLAYGALQTWSMNSDAKADCFCDNQFMKSSCAQHFVTASEQVSRNLGRHNVESDSGYSCGRTQHMFLKTDAGKLAPSLISDFNQMVPKASRSKYKPIPVIHSLGPATASHQQASASLLEILRLADVSERKTPMLWIGPTAAGHIEIRGRKSNQEIWDFDARMARTAHDNDIEVLKMWNMTVQASSWDGVRFGEKVALVQAMMVINWLSRLASS